MWVLTVKKISFKLLDSSLELSARVTLHSPNLSAHYVDMKYVLSQ